MSAHCHGTVWRGRRARSRAALSLALLAAVALGACSGRDSAALYREYSKRMTERGLFRTERAPADAPYKPSDLIKNFMKVAFEPEAQLLKFYQNRGDGGRLLSKWTGPIGYTFAGDGVTDADRATITRIASDLARHSRLDIGPASGAKPNLVIYVMSEDEREKVGARESGRAWYQSSILRDWIEKPNPPCFAIYDAGSSAGGEIATAAIFVKAEIEEPLRTACFVEEFTQTLGLVFDHDDVRPSIFNDDQEFIALTDHDRELIEILYDRRLRPGMSPKQTLPVVRRIVAERGRTRS